MEAFHFSYLLVVLAYLSRWQLHIQFIILDLVFVTNRYRFEDRGKIGATRNKILASYNNPRIQKETEIVDFGSELLFHTYIFPFIKPFIGAPVQSLLQLNMALPAAGTDNLILLSDSYKVCFEVHSCFYFSDWWVIELRVGVCVCVFNLSPWSTFSPHLAQHVDARRMVNGGKLSWSRSLFCDTCLLYSPFFSALMFLAGSQHHHSPPLLAYNVD